MSRGASSLDYRYTRSEVERMIGVSRRELDYWTRLRLVLPRARWGERFFSFTDLVALETIKRLAARRVPARRIRRAITALEAELGCSTTPLSTLRISTNGKQVVIHSPVASARPYEPLTGQFVLNFETSELAQKVHALASRSAEEWFELGMSCDTKAESLEQAVEAYRKAVDASPEWVEAHINLGTALYQLNRMDEAIKHLRRAIELSPSLADAHLNLGLAYEKGGHVQNSIRHLSLYLRYEPNGPWAEFARSRIERHRAPHPSSSSGKLTPFRRKR